MTKTNLKAEIKSGLLGLWNRYKWYAFSLIIFVELIFFARALWLRTFWAWVELGLVFLLDFAVGLAIFLGDKLWLLKAIWNAKSQEEIMVGAYAALPTPIALMIQKKLDKQAAQKLEKKEAKNDEKGKQDESNS